MYDLISSLCAGLMVFCIANMYYSFEIMLKHEFDSKDEWKREKHRFAIGINLVSIYMFIGCLTWLLWDADLISKLSQYKISLAARFFAIAGSFLFFLTLSLGIKSRHKTMTVMGAVAATLIVYLLKVFI